MKLVLIKNGYNGKAQAKDEQFVIVRSIFPSKVRKVLKLFEEKFKKIEAAGNATIYEYIEGKYLHVRHTGPYADYDLQYIVRRF